MRAESAAFVGGEGGFVKAPGAGESGIVSVSQADAFHCRCRGVVCRVILLGVRVGDGWQVGLLDVLDEGAVDEAGAAGGGVVA